MPSIFLMRQKRISGYQLQQKCLRYHRAFIAAGLLLLVQIFEMILLQRKYEIFTGGFLQPYGYKTLSSRMVFTLLSVGYDSFIISSFWLVWFYVLGRFAKNSLVVSYNFFMFGIMGIGGWLTLKYQVLSYFSDTLNFVVMKNLSGGSLTDALLYLLDETVLIVAAAIVMLIFYCAGLILIKRLRLPERRLQYSITWRALAIWGLSLVIIALITIYVKTDYGLRYGLSKKTSFFLVSKTLDKLSDIDGDGFGIFRYPGDQDSLNPNIFPGALDLPGNNIDEDGYAGDAVPLPALQDSLSTIQPAKGKHIILVVLESARGDMMGATVNGQYAAPIMRTLAAQGMSAAFAYSHTGYTTSSIKAIFNRTMYEEKTKTSLVDFLKASGYQFSFISGQDESFGGMDAAVGMDQRDAYLFDARSDRNAQVFFSAAPGSARLSEERVVKQVTWQINELDWSTPQFIYINFQSAHFPYSYQGMQKFVTDTLIPRSKIREENRDWLVKTYWNAIANADWAIGEVMNALKTKGVYDQTVLCILGDHGESLFDQGVLGHGFALNEAQTRIPLVINQPGIVIEQAIGQEDIAELVIRVALGESIQWRDKGRNIFQLVGSLDQPQLIGHVQYRERRTILDIRTRQVFFSDLQKWELFDDASNDPLLRNRVIDLIQDWETLRLQKHIAQNNKS
jgi:phosphoglycerol transferase MdoB-like AlkP superfamily enzyme